jgi:F-box protein 11
LVRFREHLESELRLQKGSDFTLLDDRNDLRWGQNWTERVRESLDQDSFLIPVLTPGFFQSPLCREELELFLERERKLRRTDLIHPIYYVSTSTLDDRLQRMKDRLAEIIGSRDLLDWRELRFEPYTTPVVGKRLRRLAETLRSATGRSSIPGLATSRGHGSRKPIQLVGLHQQQAEIGSGNGNGDHHAIPVLQYAELISGVSEVIRGAPEKSEPPSLVVDSMGRGQFRSIGDALREANAGDRILVRPGRYPESLTIEKPVELLGDGPVEEIVIEASGASTIVFRASMGRIANLSIIQSGGGQGYGIEVSQGRIVIEGCDISSRSGAGVALHGGVEASLRRNRIHDGKGSGVLFCRDAQGILEDNEIEGNALAGVLITRGAHPKLYRNRIHDGLGTGVQIEDGGEALLEENDIAGHVLAEVAICRGANPILRRNRIHDSHRSGVLVY